VEVDVNRVLSRQDTEKLLDELCVDLGFCLPPGEYRAIVDDPPESVPAFVDAVFAAEGMEPATADRHLWRQVRDVVADFFHGASDPHDGA